jgi:hypothetical protein
MKVAIFETEHFEAAYPLIRLFDKNENQLTVFCYESSYRQLELMLRDRPVACDFIVRKKNQSRISFILTIYRETRKRRIDLLFLNTVTDNFVFYALLPLFLSGTRIILGVHMIHSFFETRKKWKFRRLVRAFGKRMLRSRIREFNVISQVMSPYLREKLPPGKKVHAIPGGIFEKEIYKPAPLHEENGRQVPGMEYGK